MRLRDRALQATMLHFYTTLTPRAGRAQAGKAVAVADLGQLRRPKAFPDFPEPARSGEQLAQVIAARARCEENGEDGLGRPKFGPPGAGKLFDD